jgi:hypothetical protein
MLVGIYCDSNVGLPTRRRRRRRESRYVIPLLWYTPQLSLFRWPQRTHAAFAAAPTTLSASSSCSKSLPVVARRISCCCARTFTRLGMVARPSTPLCHPDSSRDFRKPCPAIWKYEMEAHIRRAHPGFATPGSSHGKLIPHDMVLALNLDPREEERLGVPVSTPWTSLGDYDLPPAS